MEMYKNKLLMSLKDGSISIDEFNRLLDEYSSDFCNIPANTLENFENIIKPLLASFKNDAMEEAKGIVEDIVL